MFLPIGPEITLRHSSVRLEILSPLSISNCNQQESCEHYKHSKLKIDHLEILSVSQSCGASLGHYGVQTSILICCGIISKQLRRSALYRSALGCSGTQHQGTRVRNTEAPEPKEFNSQDRVLACNMLVNNFKLDFLCILEAKINHASTSDPWFLKTHQNYWTNYDGFWDGLINSFSTPYLSSPIHDLYQKPFNLKSFIKKQK
ncbi:hypothetical protein M5K25_007607 [Dendrobium thyrsiflorum]|uniref:Uncharacterized protein n=1 Tax=Dendrobium thyrsiflorum TaxID=117978 RepID=A0ABD0VL92_DENTH